jgi:MoaA/NifB/PqqE/SkfB family radical SAM enzyme
MTAAAKSVRVLPQSLYIEPISACNLHCKMCYTNVINGPGRRLLDAEQVLTFARRFLAVTPPQVWVYWCGTGELFMHKDFPRMVNVLTAEYDDAAIRVTIQTNGTLRRLHEFTAIGRLEFNVSIDGSREFHDWHRGQGTYDRTLDFCREALDRGCRQLTVRALLTRGNVEHLDEFHQDIRDRLGPGVGVALHVPYTNRVLRGVRDSLLINQGDIDDSQALTLAEARRIMAEKYQDRYLIDEDAEAVDNYISLNTFGVYSCCHGVINIGSPDEDIPTLIARLAAAEAECRACSMFPCM